MRGLTLALTFAVAVTACGGTTRPPSGSPARTVTAVATRTPAAASPTAAVTGPAFMTTAMTDVRTGESFRLGAFPGKVVLVIAMAVW